MKAIELIQQNISATAKEARGMRVKLASARERILLPNHFMVMAMKGNVACTCLNNAQ